jgi:hypothetical protein
MAWTKTTTRVRKPNARDNIMTITYCERYNERYNSNQDADDAAKKETLILACHKIKKKMLAALDGFILSEISVDQNIMSNAEFNAAFKFEVEGYIQDAFGDVAAVPILVEAVELEG